MEIRFSVSQSKSLLILIIQIIFDISFVFQTTQFELNNGLNAKRRRGEHVQITTIQALRTVEMGYDFVKWLFLSFNAKVM